MRQSGTLLDGIEYSFCDRCWTFKCLKESVFLSVAIIGVAAIGLLTTSGWLAYNSSTAVFDLI